MRTRNAVIFIALVALALPLLAQEQKFETTIQFSNEKAEAISSFSWGVSHPGLTAGDFSFTKPVTPLSNTLFLGCTTGKHFPIVVIRVAAKKGKDKGQQQFLEIKLTDVLVSSFRLSGGEGDPVDTTSLTYASAEYTIMNP